MFESEYKGFQTRLAALTQQLSQAGTQFQSDVASKAQLYDGEKTRVLSVALYAQVEDSEFADAHRLAAGMVVFALVVLVTLYVVNRPAREPQARSA